MCDGYKERVRLNEYGLIFYALRHVNCGKLEFEPEVKQEYIKCKHGHVMCGICERVQRRKDDKGNK